jgi:hypothetical protein
MAMRRLPQTAHKHKTVRPGDKVLIWKVDTWIPGVVRTIGDKYLYVPWTGTTWYSRKGKLWIAAVPIDSDLWRRVRVNPSKRGPSKNARKASTRKEIDAMIESEIRGAQSKYESSMASRASKENNSNFNWNDCPRSLRPEPNNIKYSGPREDETPNEYYKRISLRGKGFAVQAEEEEKQRKLVEFTIIFEGKRLTLKEWENEMAKRQQQKELIAQQEQQQQQQKKSTQSPLYLFNYFTGTIERQEYENSLRDGMVSDDEDEVASVGYVEDFDHDDDDFRDWEDEFDRMDAGPPKQNHASKSKPAAGKKNEREANNTTATLSNNTDDYYYSGHENGKEEEYGSSYGRQQQQQNYNYGSGYDKSEMQPSSSNSTNNNSYYPFASVAPSHNYDIISGGLSDSYSSDSYSSSNSDSNSYSNSYSDPYSLPANYSESSFTTWKLDGSQDNNNDSYNNNNIYSNNYAPILGDLSSSTGMNFQPVFSDTQASATTGLVDRSLEFNLGAVADMSTNTTNTNNISYSFYDPQQSVKVTHFDFSSSSSSSSSSGVSYSLPIVDSDNLSLSPTGTNSKKKRNRKQNAKNQREINNNNDNAKNNSNSNNNNNNSNNSSSNNNNTGSNYQDQYKEEKMEEQEEEEEEEDAGGDFAVLFRSATSSSSSLPQKQNPNQKQNPKQKQNQKQNQKQQQGSGSSNSSSSVSSASSSQPDVNGNSTPLVEGKTRKQLKRWQKWEERKPKREEFKRQQRLLRRKQQVNGSGASKK